LRAAPGSEIFTSTASFVIEANYQPRSVDAGIIQGILVPGDAQNKQVYLILPKIHFQPNRDYLVTTLGTTKKLKLGKPVLSMDDWVKVALPVA
jgi:hypothetical protein